MIIIVFSPFFFQLFKREEQNFVSQNEIDNMALIMPSQAKGLSVVKDSDDKRDTSHRKKDKKRLEAHNSLNVACLKRLFPIGLSFFSGREQELLQHTKERLIKVRKRSPPGSEINFMQTSYISAFVIYVELKEVR